MNSVHKAKIKFGTGQTLEADRLNKADWLATVSKGNSIERKILIRTHDVEVISRLGSSLTEQTRLGLKQIPHHEVAPVTNAISEEVTSWLVEQTKQGKIMLNEAFSANDVQDLVRRMMMTRIRAHRNLASKRRQQIGFAKKEGTRA